MKRICLAIIIGLILTSFRVDLTGPWISTSKGNVFLNTRPQNYSKSNSPDSTIIQQILKEQNRVIDHINLVLHTKFNSKVQIYLFNFDEAKAKIGTNGGGSCSASMNWIFFTYFEKPNNYSSKDTFVYLGIHEMVHIITREEIGFPKTRLLGEGFANAIDGTYGRVSIFDRMKEFIKNNNVIRPSDLLEKTDIPEKVFYPQSGFFIKWLFDNYGIENVKKLYKVNASNFAKKFKRITGDDFNFMTDKYLKYCDTLK